ncbi:hypothetical protein GNI_114530 [Gregarina niphandrodes]|uniref:Uncharacterized protein n=1 Tax=Gregarina niphandrodes TaxID=110365 RepID=A0A023B380_GRENI|nr:hypothetical protein GNI_114530 [Gregarina niphandrodes]EZG55344.1 hypothetical protein GNI_114530 [Gregarina niphandrodes]|eukprot:XP_011131639.1 hypothetical protein GNI_114530 [Gregarina niphandrodes]
MELKEVVVLKYTPNNQDRERLMLLPYQEFVDRYAIVLFAFSDEINVVCQRLQTQDRGTDTMKVIDDFLLLKARFQELYRRWNHKSRYRALDYCYCLLRKIDREIEIRIRWDQLDASVNLKDDKLASFFGELPLIQDPNFASYDSGLIASQEAEETFTVEQINERIRSELSATQKEDVGRLLLQGLFSCDFARKSSLIFQLKQKKASLPKLFEMKLRIIS